MPHMHSTPSAYTMYTWGHPTFIRLYTESKKETGIILNIL